METLTYKKFGDLARRPDAHDDTNPPSSSPKLIENSILKQPRYVTSGELAETLSVSVHTIRKWRQQGRIIPKKFGRSVRYAVDEVVTALTRKGSRHA